MSVRVGPGKLPSARPPDLSVVVPSVNGWRDLKDCLRALWNQSGDYTVEVLVPDRVGESVQARLRQNYPNVRILSAAPEATIPALRAMAFRAARADIVAVIEDHVIVPPDWVEKMLAAHQEGAMVVGGAIDNAARDGLTDWAAFLCEYSHCLAPQAGPAKWLPGNNVSYRRSLLESFRHIIDQERWEDYLHANMQNAGITLISRPNIGVEHKKHYTVSEYLTQRYLYARAYAAMKVDRSGFLRKCIYGLGAFTLPPVLLLRTWLRVSEARQYRLQFLRSLPLLLLFFTSWAVGEAIGYWFGAGEALRKVR